MSYDHKYRDQNHLLPQLIELLKEMGETNTWRSNFKYTHSKYSFIINSQLINF